MDQTFYAGSDFDECTVVSHNNNFTFHLVTNFQVRIKSIPWMRSKLFQTQSDTFLFVIEVKDNNVEFLIQFNNFFRIANASPRKVCNVDVYKRQGQVSENWEQLKLKEKDGNKSVLSGVPAALPSLIKAYRIQDKVRNVGFDWEEREQVWDKVKEEIGEFQEEVANMDKDKAEAEFGDVMFSLINAARLYKINPDNALERTNQKFIRRFNYLEEHTIKEGKNLKDMSLEEMDAIWNEAKKKGL